MDALRDHWSDDRIVELLAAISLSGFLNRRHDTLATDLEDVSHEMGNRVLGEAYCSAAGHRYFRLGLDNEVGTD